MPFTMTIQCFDDYLRIQTVGTLDDISEVKQYVTQLYKAAQKNERKKVLLDERELIEKQDTYDVYACCESEGVARLAQAGIRIASCCRPQSLELNRNYETILSNRSVLFRAFLEEDTAIQWLNS